MLLARFHMRGKEIVRLCVYTRARVFLRCSMRVRLSRHLIDRHAALKPVLDEWFR